MMTQEEYAKFIRNLNKLLQGKVIKEIQPCKGGGDGVCRIVTEDGTSVEIHATDLGVWARGSTRLD